MRRIGRILELLGIRYIYRGISIIATDSMLSFDQRPQLIWDDIKDIRDNSRYFAWANVLRGVLYLPVIYIAVGLQEWITVFALGLLVAIHCVLILNEIYRNAISNFWLDALSEKDDHEVVERKERVAKPVPQPHWFFSSKPWESVEIYKLIGVERFRQWVVEYTNRTKFTPAERAAGRRVEYVRGDKQSIYNYEFDTRFGEIMHLIAVGFNIPPFVSLLRHQSWGWLAFVTLILTLDLYLVMLQRYNRFRVHKLLAKMAQPRGVRRETSEVATT